MLQSGDAVHTYVVIGQKGSGNFGRVFEVRDNATNEQLALKLFTNPSGDNEARFRAENDHLHTLIDHINIIDPKTRVLDIGGRTFYCMELADISAEEHITPNPLNNLEALQLFKEICEGMKYAHDNDIVHRDLHLGNVLLAISTANQLSPRLTDFGRAKDFSATNLGYIPATIWGVVGTWSPEVFFLIWEDAEINEYIRADIYALGVMLHSLLASSPVPYTAGLINSIATYMKNENVAGNGNIQINSSLDIAERLLHHQAWLGQYDRSNQSNLNVALRQPDPVLEKEVNRIIQKCCAPDYNDRYVNTEELLQDVRTIC